MQFEEFLRILVRGRALRKAASAPPMTTLEVHPGCRDLTWVTPLSWVSSTR
jgi:hypothetical protein